MPHPADLCDQIDDAFIHEDAALEREQRRKALTFCSRTEDGEHVFHLGWCLECNSEEPE